ncbi:hypothetical protein BABINDRAFT_162054, partial [Babjeviella inositovora NRRL Y-12698]
MSSAVSRKVKAIYGSRLDKEYLDVDELREVLLGLDELVPSFGISRQDLGHLIDVVLPPSLIPVFAKNHVAEHYLLCVDPIPTAVVMKVVGAIGMPSQVPKTLQLKLLKWLLGSVSFWEDPTLHQKIYGIMFNYLTFEYSRPYISFFIFLFTRKHHIKPWRVEFISDLQARFPFDEYFQALHLLFSNSSPAYRINPRIFRFPNVPYLLSMKALGVLKMDTSESHPNTLQGAIVHNNPKLSESLAYVTEFERILLRRRGPLNNILHCLRDNETTFINEVHSHKDLLEVVGRERFPNLNALMIEYLRSDILVNDFKLQYYLIHHTTDDLQSLDRWVELQLFDEDISPSEFKRMVTQVIHIYELSNHTLQFLVINKMIGGVEPPVLKAGLVGFWETSLSSLMLLTSPVHHWDEFYAKFMRGNLGRCKSDPDYLLTFMSSVLNMLWAWLLQSSDNLSPVIASQTLRSFHNLTIDAASLDIHFLVRSLKCLQFVIDIGRDNKPFLSSLDPDVVVLPAPLVYTYLLSPHPLVVSEICRYISFTKSYNFENKQSFKQLHNSYVMDICNMLWRDKAYEGIPGTSNKGLFLPDRFASQISKIPDERTIVFKRIGNIFHNPAFASVTAEIIREIEDESETCQIRHAGPLTLESVSELLMHPVPWLDITYEDLRVEVLRRLGDKYGIDGVPELLFTSLKSLIHRR